jgi:hypothetical protein
MKSLSTGKDLLLKVDKVFPWETFRVNLSHLTPRNPSGALYYSSKSY